MYEGYGEAGLAHVALANRSMRLMPSGITSATGLVRSPENVLEDTVSAAWFGDSRTREQMLHPFRAKLVSTVVLSLVKGKWYRNSRMTGEGVPELGAAVSAGDDFVVDYVRVYDVER